MNIKECFEAMHGDYNDVLTRLPKDSIIIKFLRKFEDNKEFEELLEASEAKDYQRVFELSHDLKGMAANLGIKGFSIAASELCEAVRGGEAKPGYEDLLEKAKEEYFATKEAIASLEDA